jgi:hypothetical protein
MTYEVSTLPVLDVRRLDSAASERIAAANERLVAGEADAHDALDRAVLDALDTDLSVERLRELQAAMVQRRVQGGAATEVLVESADAGEATPERGTTDSGDATD